MKSDLLLKIASAIPAEEFDMDTWAGEAPCGTVGCLAYHVIKEHGYKPVHWEDGASYLCVDSECKEEPEYISTVAGKILDLNDCQRPSLFHVSGWGKYSLLYANAKSFEERKEVMLAFIREFIENEK